MRLRLQEFRGHKRIKDVNLLYLRTDILNHSGHMLGTHFHYSLGQFQDHSEDININSMTNINDTKGNQTRDFPHCSAVPQPPARPINQLKVPCNSAS
jgi:hypothetical protein